LTVFIFSIIFPFSKTHFCSITASVLSCAAYRSVASWHLLVSSDLMVEYCALTFKKCRLLVLLTPRSRHQFQIFFQNNEIRAKDLERCTLTLAALQLQWATSLFWLRLSLSLFAEPKLKLNAIVCT